MQIINFFIIIIIKNKNVTLPCCNLSKSIHKLIYITSAIKAYVKSLNIDFFHLKWNLELWTWATQTDTSLLQWIFMKN